MIKFKKLIKLKKNNMKFKNNTKLIIIIILLSITGCNDSKIESTTIKTDKKTVQNINSESSKTISNLEEELGKTVNAVETEKNDSNNTSNKDYYSVVDAVDGDTIKIDYNGETETLRFIGIDTPETRDPRKPVQCFGKEASNRTKELTQGKKVAVEFDPTQGKRDKYNRLLVYVILEDGNMLNRLLIEEGFAHEYTYNIPYKYQSEFKEKEKEAREKKRGLWGDKCGGNTTQEAPNNETNKAGIEEKKEAAPEPVSTPENEASTSTTGAFNCDCSKTCSKMKNCEEAKYQLKECGCDERDGDGDGVPCESLCR